MPETDAFSYMVRNYSKISSRPTGIIQIINQILLKKLFLNILF